MCTGGETEFDLRWISDGEKDHLRLGWLGRKATDYSELREKLLARIVRLGLFRALGAGTTPDSFEFQSPFLLAGSTPYYRTSLKLLSNRALPDSIELFRAIPMGPEEEDAVYAEDLRFWLNEDLPDEKFRIP